MGWCGGVDGESSAVDHNVVVVPAQGGEVVCVGWSALGPGVDVVGLEPVSADAAFDGADASVSVEDEAAEAGWDDPGSASHVDRCPVGGSAGDFDDALAEDGFDRVGSDSGSGFDNGPGFAVGGCGVVGVDEDGE